jgi:hypothetical protein
MTTLRGIKIEACLRLPRSADHHDFIIFIPQRCDRKVRNINYKGIMKNSKSYVSRATSVIGVAISIVVAVAGFTVILSKPLVAKEQADPKRKTCLEFSELSMTLERNATDGDTEVVIFAKGQDAGLKRLVIAGPNGNHVAAFTGSGKGVGIREFVLESAEPPDLDLVLASFPEGEYTISGRTVDGECIVGTASLSHQVAPATTLITPTEEQTVPVDQVVLSWAAVAGTERYVVELNNETTGSEFTFQIFPPTTSLAIPAHFLQAGSEYQFGVGVRTTNNNITFVETTFFTAP